MAEADLDNASAGATELVLDPFGHLPGIASRVAGLGGAAPGHDPTYVFHTDYVEAAAGAAHFKVQFSDLTAKQGTLVLRVHMIAEGAHSILANSERIQLNRLIAQGGGVNVRFEAFRGVRFALYGSIAGNTDAEANGVSITLDRPAHHADVTELEIDGRTSSFGRDKAKPAQQLVSLERATLHYPVSQICTERQLREPVYREWLSELAIGDRGPAEQWSSIYIMQVLSRYGLLVPGASGLGLGVESSVLPRAMAARDVSIVSLRHSPADGTETVEAADDELMAAEGAQSPHASRIRFKKADIGALPRDIVNFDFVWSSGTAASLGTLPAGMDWINECLTRLRPGGFAVHVLPYNLSSNEDTIEHGETVLFRRMDLERLGLILISRGHEVAQIKIDAKGAPALDYRAAADAPNYDATACGFVVRKAATAL